MQNAISFIDTVETVDPVVIVVHRERTRAPTREARSVRVPPPAGKREKPIGGPMGRKHVRAATSMTEQELGEHIEQWHNETVWLATKSAHAEDHRQNRQGHIHDRG